MDFIPQVNYGPATSLAEITAKINAQKTQSLSDMIKSLGSSASGVFDAYNQRKANTLTPQQAQALGLGGSGPAYSLPAGAQGPVPTQSQNLQSAFPKGVPKDLATKMLEAKMTTDRMMGVQTLKGTQAAERQEIPVDAGVKQTYKTAYGQDLPEFVKTIPKDEFDKASALAQQKLKPAAAPKGSGLQADKFVQGEMDKANRSVNPLNAMRGTALGNAGVMKTRLATAAETLADPNITPQQLAAVTTDLASIVQMGTPHEMGIKDQDYSTWYTKAKALAGRIANSPKAASSPDTVAKLKELVSGYDKVYSKLVNTNLDAHKSSVKTLLSKYPDFKTSYDALEKDIRSQYPMDSDKGGLSLPGADEIQAELDRRSKNGGN